MVNELVTQGLFYYFTVMKSQKITLDHEEKEMKKEDK